MKNEKIMIVVAKEGDFKYGIHDKDVFIKSILTTDNFDKDIIKIMKKRLKQKKNIIMYTNRFGGQTVGGIQVPDVEEIHNDYELRDILFHSMLLRMESQVEVSKAA